MKQMEFKSLSSLDKNINSTTQNNVQKDMLLDVQWKEGNGYYVNSPMPLYLTTSIAYSKQNCGYDQNDQRIYNNKVLMNIPVNNACLLLSRWNITGT